MARRDIEMAVVTVNLKHHDEKWAEHLKVLENHGLAITEAHESQSTVEGTIVAERLHGLEHLDFVTYVRKHHSFSAEHEKGHPLDRNQGIGSTPDDVARPRGRRLGKRYP